MRAIRSALDRLSPRRASRLAAPLALAAFASTAGAAPPPITLTTLAESLAQPVAITHAGDARLFITEQAGRVVIWNGAALLPQPFLDIRGRVLLGSEQGLLSVAFHPAYAQNGFFYVDYTDLSGDTVISRFSVSPGNPNDALEGSERVLLRIPQPYPNHNGGQLQFGPDGYLYVGMGDGGSGFDPECYAQRDNTLLGKLLRLDVNQNLDQPPYHGIPPSNPFVGPGPPLNEIWAKGLRNPWRFTFDRRSGDLFVGDVGQNTREEVSFQPRSSHGGENYGWKMMEGNLCLSSGAGCPGPIPGCDAPQYVAPILDYDHDGGGCSVIGGYVYRGSRIPGLFGSYLYGDFCTGELWAAEKHGASWQSFALSPSVPGLTSFGEGLDGELYLVGGSRLRRVDGPPLPTSCQPSGTRLCLLGGRFLVEATWRTAAGQQGAGQAVSLTADAGYFWFFSAANPELFVKVRDACVAPFDRFWVFAAGLTNVELRLTVIDTEAGVARVYENPSGTAFEAVQDTGAFATCP